MRNQHYGVFSKSIVVYGVSFVAGLQGSRSVAAEADQLDKIRAAWDRRAASASSFQYDCDFIKPKVVAVGKGTGDPFANSPAAGERTQVVLLHGDFSFSVDEKKLAYREDSELWDESTGSKHLKRTKTTFVNGLSKQVVAGAETTLGAIATTPVPDATLTNFATLDPFWLAYDAALELKRCGLDLTKMKASDITSVNDGTEFIQLELPKSDPSWRTLVRLDPAREFVPVQFVVQLKGQTRRELSIQYVSHPKVGWRVRAWTDKWFDANGPTSTMSGNVLRFSANTLLGGEVFDVVFPCGAQVVDTTGVEPKFFLITPDGTHKQIRKSEYGVSRVNNVGAALEKPASSSESTPGSAKTDSGPKNK